MQHEIIAIDGPVGVGKSSAARELARKTGLTYLDTGAMYRSITLAALRAGVSLEDREELKRIARESSVELRTSGEELRVLLNGEDVSSEIRTPEVARATSPVADCIGVRERLVELQRELGARGGVVCEGRDIATVVFPKARYKFYLYATIDIRARRRFLEHHQRGEQVDFEQLRNEVRTRDRRDRARPFGPLKIAEDATIVDTSKYSLPQVVNILEAMVRNSL